MNWKKAIGYGIALWTVIFAVFSMFIAWNMYGSSWSQWLGALVGYAIAVIFAFHARIPNYAAAVGYALVWVAIGITLDALITLRFNPLIFSSWPLWAGYGLGFLAPFVAVRKGYAGKKKNYVRTFEA